MQNALNDESEQIDVTVAASGPGCLECTLTDGWWVHLRRCAACGHVGCCDSSPSQHASEHAEATGHRFIQSFEPGEEWFYDFATGEMTDGPQLAAPTERPAEQPVPGPAGRVPAHWMSKIHR